ncbi:MAG: hypothetical protein ACK52J_02530 [bacterium]
MGSIITILKKVELTQEQINSEATIGYEIICNYGKFIIKNI